MKKLLIAAGLGSLGFVSQILVAQTPSSTNGKQLFEQKNCWQCHGGQGQGGLAGPRLAQTKLNLQGFRAVMRNPPSSNMPPYRESILSDAQIADLFAFVQSIPAPKAASEIPLLREP